MNAPFCTFCGDPCDCGWASAAELSDAAPMPAAGDEAWIDWQGGENPVPGQMVSVRQRWARDMTTGGTAARPSERWDWSWTSGDHNVIAYRVVTEAQT